MIEYNLDWLKKKRFFKKKQDKRYGKIREKVTR